MVRVLKLLVLVPIAVIVLAFAIANRVAVSVSFDPFSAANASEAFITAPLFIILLLTLMIGVLIGGIATWLTQGRHRRVARVARDEAHHWQVEARRAREGQPAVPASTGLVVR